jgi:hypothetical protein
MRNVWETGIAIVERTLQSSESQRGGRNRAHPLLANERLADEGIRKGG